MSAVTPSDLADPSSARDADRPFELACRGCSASRWHVLANCADYLRFIVRQGKLSGSPGIARTSDLVNRTIVDAWQKFSGFRGDNDRQLRGWVKAILINSARNQRRDARPSVADSIRILGEIPDRGPTPDEAVEDSERMRRIDAALVALKEKDRKVIRMRVWDDLTFTEIGRSLGMTEDAARMQFARALDRLRRRMRSNNGLG